MENNKNYKTAKTLVLIPIIILTVAIICFIIAGIIEQPTNRGLLYSLLMIISIFLALLGPLPSIILSVIGSIHAYRAKIENPKWLILFLIGIFNILVFVVIAAACILMIFVGGAGV